MGRLTRLGLVLLTLSLVYPAAVLAQGSISGIVRDTSGAVLPGVTVEAASPVLIEKARTAVTDGAGQYRIVDLRPGTYVVTFTLPGFSIVKREGIELAGAFAATVNADLRVGTVEETITVTGEAPVVDVQNTTKQAVMTREILDAIPAGRNHRLFAVLIPGMSGGGGDVGGQNALSLTSISIHGGRSTDQRLKVDGTSIRNTAGEGWSTNFIPDMSSTQEVTVDYASGSAENVTSGVTFNYIPREGSNRFTMSIFATGVNSSFQGDNYSPELAAAGLGARNKLHTLVDVNPSAGGPILRDRLWFYSAARWQVNKNYVGGLWNNQNAGDLTRWDYVPGDQAVFSLTQGSGNGRVTWQAAAKHKVNFFFEDQTRDYNWVHLPEAPEANQHWTFPRMWVASTKYSAPLTSRLLLEGGFTRRTEDIWDPHPDPGDPFQDAISVTEQGGIIPGLRYRGIQISVSIDTDMWEVTGALSYVTGSHALKVGVSNYIGSRVGWNPDSLPTSLVYRFLNGVPNQITQRQRNYDYNEAGVRAELGIYAQDRWTLKRLTLTPGIRFEYLPLGLQRVLSRTAHPAAQPEHHVPRGVVVSLHGHHAADGGRLRSVRQREDRAQGEPVQVHGGPQRARRGDIRGPAGAVGDAHVDRRQPQLHARLRSHQPLRAEQPCHRRRLLRDDLGFCGTGRRSRAPATIPRCWRAGAGGRTTGSSRPGSSTRWRRA